MYFASAWPLRYPLDQRITDFIYQCTYCITHPPSLSLFFMQKIHFLWVEFAASAVLLNGKFTKQIRNRRSERAKHKSTALLQQIDCRQYGYLLFVHFTYSKSTRYTESCETHQHPVQCTPQTFPAPYATAPADDYSILPSVRQEHHKSLLQCCPQ